MTTYEQWDVVVVPFPFVDLPRAKPRPALVLSDTSFTERGLVILAMITTKREPPRYMDVHIEDIESAGVVHPSVVRWKVFSLDSQMIRKSIGRLGGVDVKRCSDALRSVFSLEKS